MTVYLPIAVAPTDARTVDDAQDVLVTPSGSAIPRALGDILGLPAAEPIARSPKSRTPIIEDEGGSVLLSAEGDGGLHFLPSLGTVDEVRKALYLSPSILRGAALQKQAVNVRRDGRALLATVQEADGRVSDVRQPVEMPTGTAVVDGVDPLHGLFVYGQSNAGGGGSFITSLQAARYPYHCLTFPGAILTQTAAPAGSCTDFVGLYNTAAELFVATSSGIAAEAWARSKGERTQGRFHFSVSYGGQAIAQFQKGTTTYNNLIYAAGKFVDVAAKYGRKPVLDRILWVQGETSSANYAADFNMLVTNANADIAAATGGAAPKWLVAQINTIASEAGFRQEPLDLLSVVRSRPSEMTMVGPMYQYPLQADDGLHPTEIGKFMFGESVALADEYLRAGSFNPLWPLASGAVTRTTNVIDVKFQLPPGTTGLAFDADWVRAATNYGFVYTDDSGAPPAITNVAIVGSDTVRITLASTPTGANRKVQYALGQGPVGDNLWASGRGQLYAPTTRSSLVSSLGLGNAPATVRHYAVRFQEIVP